MSISTSLSRRIPTNQGKIIEITVVGKYPPGSAGTEDAKRMREDAEDIIRSEEPARVLFNLQGLEYVWGDAICYLSLTILGKASRSAKPACVLAKGRTARALEPLFENGWSFAVFGMQLFETEEDALQFLQERLSGDEN